MTVEQAIQQGLKVGDIIKFEWSIFEFEVLDLGLGNVLNVMNTETFESIMLEPENEHIIICTII